MSYHTCRTKYKRLLSRVTFTGKINVLTLHSAFLYLHSSFVGIGVREQTSSSLRAATPLLPYNTSATIC